MDKVYRKTPTCSECNKPLVSHYAVKCKPCNRLGIHTSTEFKKGHKVNLGGKGNGKPKKEEWKKRMSILKGGTGILNPRKSHHLKDVKYKTWRSDVFARDKWGCKTCNTKGDCLEAHHIKGWSKYPELRFTVSNGVTLCKNCHKLAHRRKNNG